MHFKSAIITCRVSESVEWLGQSVMLLAEWGTDFFGTERMTENCWESLSIVNYIRNGSSIKKLKPKLRSNTRTILTYKLECC